MALRAKSIDEETAELADAYDELMKPKKLFRSHNNKLYLVLRAYAAGKVGLTDAALALHNRFDPLFCDDVDLYTAAKLVGTEFKRGAGSMLKITVLNRSVTGSKILPAAVYNYLSASGMVFSFELPNDWEFNAEETRAVTAISREKGSFPVGGIESIKLFRSDGLKVDSAFKFSCESNAGRLGYPDESPFDFRTRILNDADRQDHIRELELKIRNLPNIFECNIVFNDDVAPQEYDGLTLEPKELLITITGVPTNEIANLVCEHVVYDTHKVNPDDAVYYFNDLLLNGSRPVYYRYHDKTNFSLAVTYQYDAGKLKPAQVENAINLLFKPYTMTVTHQAEIAEKDIYRILEGLKLPNVKILNADIFNSDGGQVPFVRIPKTRLPHLTGILFTAVEQGDMQ